MIIGFIHIFIFFKLITKQIILLKIVIYNNFTVTDLDTLLKNLNLDAYSEFFKENNIDVSAFLKLNEHDLKLLGIR